VEISKGGPRGHLPRWRKRAWVILAWTVCAIAVGFFLVRAAWPSTEPQTHSGGYAAFGAGAEEAANAQIEGLLLFGWFLAWAVGIAVIVIAAGLVNWWSSKKAIARIRASAPTNRRWG